MTTTAPLTPSPGRLSVAPMMDWTDRHCRYFHRLLTRRTLLYTEMVTTGALLHGDVPRHLVWSKNHQHLRPVLNPPRMVKQSKTLAHGLCIA